MRLFLVVHVEAPSNGCPTPRVIDVLHSIAITVCRCAVSSPLVRVSHLLLLRGGGGLYLSSSRIDTPMSTVRRRHEKAQPPPPPLTSLDAKSASLERQFGDGSPLPASILWISTAPPITVHEQYIQLMQAMRQQHYCSAPSLSVVSCVAMCSCSPRGHVVAAAALLIAIMNINGLRACWSLQAAGSTIMCLGQLALLFLLLRNVRDTRPPCEMCCRLVALHCGSPF